MSPSGRFCCKSRPRPRVGGPLVMSVGFDPPIPAALRNFDATQCTKPGREALVRPAPRTVAGSERWRSEQTHPGHLAGRAVGAARFTPNQTGREARFDDTLEHEAKNISLSETLVAGERER
jgi:hypothetical protein